MPELAAGAALDHPDANCFRIGQSFWPDLPERAPEELSNRISVRPLSDTGCAGRSVLAEEAFHWLTCRGGPTCSSSITLQWLAVAFSHRPHLMSVQVVGWPKSALGS
jgi:hypothetical protein